MAVADGDAGCWWDMRFFQAENLLGRRASSTSAPTLAVALVDGSSARSNSAGQGEGAHSVGKAGSEPGYWSRPLTRRGQLQI